MSHRTTYFIKKNILCVLPRAAVHGPREHMDSQEQKAKDDHLETWTTSRSVHLQLDLLRAFESGDFHDCSIRVGCNLKDPNSPYKVCK